MQPKTKREKRVMELFSTLKPLTKAQEQWGLYLYPTRAFWNTKGNICAYCGETMGESLKCPVCGAIHKERAENNRKRESSYFFNICTSIQEFQVLRTFEVLSTYARGKRRLYGVCEVCQSWIDEKGKETRVARAKSCFGADFIWWSDMEIRTGAAGAYSYYGDLQYHYQDTYTYAKGSILPILKRNGLQSVVMLNKCKENPVILMQKLLTDSKTETLVKTGNVHLVGERYIDRYWKQILLCIRHNYRIQDWTMWRDTIDMLQDEGKDIHNPVYVCPQDLTALHDKLLQKAENRRKREEYLEKLAKQNNPKAQKMYQQAKGMYFGICITDEELTIEVLKSIEEFIKEGEFMHHCVNRCAYYSKENSLILSAKVNGKRMETIEIDLQRMTIVQSRGKCNMNTPYHDRIVDLMNANMGQIKKIKQQAMKVA